MLLYAARKLGMLFSEADSGKMKQLAQRVDDEFIKNAERYTKTPYAFLKKENVEGAADKLAGFMSKFNSENASLTSTVPEGDTMKALVKLLLDKVPPASPAPRVVGEDSKPC